MANAQGTPAVAMTTADSTGPTIWPVTNWSVFTPTASVSSSRGTSDGRIDTRAGFARAYDVFSANEMTMMWISAAAPENDRTARIVDSTPDATCVTMTTTRRSK